MGAKTKIIVLHMKELIYTGIIVLRGIPFIVLLVMMFVPDKKQTQETTTTSYIPGVYTSTIDFKNRSVDVQVIVDKNRIKDISLVELTDSVAVMYPLMEPTMERLRDQIVDQQSLEDITYEAENQYTSAVLVHAIDQALQKATPSE